MVTVCRLKNVNLGVTPLHANEGIEEMPSENYRSFFLVLCKRGRSKARLKIKHASINSVRREEGKSVNEKKMLA